jgi:hypothetical protein
MEEHFADGIRLCSAETDKESTPESEEQFYGSLNFFDESPFDTRQFAREQSFLLAKVKEAIASMEEDIEETDWGNELLSSTFHINAWKGLVSQLEDSIALVDDHEKLEKSILQCAVTFYRELMDPIRSIRQFDYLLHLHPDEPTHWGAYALCLIDMSEQCLPSVFDMEKRSVHCFLRGARLCLAHYLAQDRWVQEIGNEDALKLGREYYYNASDAYPNTVARKGIFLAQYLAKAPALPGKESIDGSPIEYEGEDLRGELGEILGLKISAS